MTRMRGQEEWSSGQEGLRTAHRGSTTTHSPYTYPLTFSSRLCSLARNIPIPADRPCPHLVHSPSRYQPTPFHPGSFVTRQPTLVLCCHPTHHSPWILC